MNLVIVSFFRNNEGLYIHRFMEQVSRLLPMIPSTRVSAVYGDCIDRTLEHLLRRAEEHNVLLNLTEHSHGGPVFGSTEAPERIVALSGLGDAGLASVERTDDFVLYVESDLIWSAQTILSLLLTLQALSGPGIIAPLVFAGEYFYDVFCYRKDGSRFSPLPPYHFGLNLNGLTAVDSVGSCFVMHAEVARNCRMKGNVLLGFCQDARDHGYSIAVDARERVYHPV